MKSYEGYGVLVLNPNENHLEVERPGDATPPPAATPEPADEPAEKRERKDEKEGKKKREFYEKYRNPQRERETEQTPIRACSSRCVSSTRRSPDLPASPPPLRGSTGYGRPIDPGNRENSSPEEHVQYVWDHFVSKAAAKNVFIVAHSYGGLSFVELMKQREGQVKRRVCAVALTDSAHNIWLQDSSKSMQDWMQERCRNWVSSPLPLDAPVDAMLPDCPRFSAGTAALISLHNTLVGSRPRQSPGSEVGRPSLCPRPALAASRAAAIVAGQSGGV
ncbi:unnamed protein product [Arctogadus glacialis]